MWEVVRDGWQVPDKAVVQGAVPAGAWARWDAGELAPAWVRAVVVAGPVLQPDRGAEVQSAARRAAPPRDDRPAASACAAADFADLAGTRQADVKRAAPHSSDSPGVAEARWVHRDARQAGAPGWDVPALGDRASPRDPVWFGQPAEQFADMKARRSAAAVGADPIEPGQDADLPKE